MFEPLLGLLTRGYVAGGVCEGWISGCAIDSPRCRQGSDGTMFEPLPERRWCRAILATTRGRSGCRNGGLRQDLKAQPRERSRKLRAHYQARVGHPVDIAIAGWSGLPGFVGLSE
jgi:hypothetical protein